MRLIHLFQIVVLTIRIEKEKTLQQDERNPMNHNDLKWNRIPYGGDYNPEQWPEEVWERDMQLLREAHVNTLTLNVFSWAKIQPSEDTYDFTQLDRIMDLVGKNGMDAILATSTGAHPAWMARRHPDILRTEANGVKRTFGGRHNSCPNSPTFRMYAPRLAGKLAERYKDRDNIILWHVGNEFGGYCYCENCRAAFRRWLEKKYGTIEELNRRWDTAFWGHTFYSFDEVEAPDFTNELLPDGRTQFQTISLDYRRFQSDSMLECFCLERDAIREHTPQIPVTTNLMGFCEDLDYRKWAKEMDVVTWDNYPSNGMEPARIAMAHDLMRGVSGGAPFLLMEQTPSVTNWLPYNALKRPGVMRLWSWQAVAHGSDSVLFFQMRRSMGNCEKLHGAVIDHVGTGETRVFREIKALGGELEGYWKTSGESFNGTAGKIYEGSFGRTPAKVALYFDWNNWWAIHQSAGPSTDLNYIKEFYRFYRAFYRANVPVDIVGPEDDLEKYKILAAPVLYMIPGTDAIESISKICGGSKDVGDTAAVEGSASSRASIENKDGASKSRGYDEKIRSFVKNGGSFITTFFSGIVDDNDLVHLGGYPGPLRDILGIWVEETDALPREAENHFSWDGKRYPGKLVCDLLHTEGAEAISNYEEDFYAGMPVLTRNSYGQGQAWYVATASSDDFYDALVKKLCMEGNVLPLYDSFRPDTEDRTTRAETAGTGADSADESPDPWNGIEVTVRETAEEKILFFLNHTNEERVVTLPADVKQKETPGVARASLLPYGVKVIKIRK